MKTAQYPLFWDGQVAKFRHDAKEEKGNRLLQAIYHDQSEKHAIASKEKKVISIK